MVVKMFITEESMVRNWPAALVRLKSSAKKRGLALSIGLGALMVVMRNGRASTLRVVEDIKNLIKTKILPQKPPELVLRQLADQSLFVRASIVGVLRRQSEVSRTLTS